MSPMDGLLREPFRGEGCIMSVCKPHISHGLGPCPNEAPRINSARLMCTKSIYY